MSNQDIRKKLIKALVNLNKHDKEEIRQVMALQKKYKELKGGY